MDNDTEVLLDLKFDDLIKQLQRLTEMYEANQAKLKEIAETSGKASKEYLELSASQKVLRGEMGTLEKQMVAETKAQKANEGSLVQMRAELQRLNAQYDNMTGFDRMGQQGTALQQRIKALSAEIQGLEENTGRWQRNVGNYKSALQGLKDTTEAVGLSSKGLDRIMKGLSGNPWIMIVEVLVTVLVKLRDRMKGTEQVTASLGKAMGALQPVFDWFSKAISKLADIFSNVLDWAIQKTIDALGWLGRQLQKLGNLFGKDWGSGLIAYSDTMKQTANATTETAEATKTLADSTKDYTTALKEARKELGKLIDELPTLEKVKKTLKEQSDELKKNLTAGFKAYYDDVAKTKLMIDDIMGKIVKDYKPVYDNIKKVAIDLDAFIGKAEKLDKEKYKLKGTINDGTAFMERMEAEDSPLIKFQLEFDKNAKEIESTSTALQSSFGSLSSIYEQMSKDDTKSEEERAKAARNAKRWAALQIAANSGTAIAKGVAEAVSAGPFPANLAAIATTLAAIVAAIAQAKALAAESHETGGVIGGFSGATMGHDNTVINARRGEMVLNANQQKQLFDIANGGSTTSLAASLAAAIQSMPAPVLEYSEFTRFEQRVATLNETQKMK